MAHAVHTRNLGRNQSWRKATVRSLAQALLTREQIQTTLAKAKEAQRMTERLITLGKQGDLQARRQALQLLADPHLVKKLFSEVAPRYATRSGGYTRILHNGFRAGDAASMAVIELVERAPEKKEAPKPKAAAETQKPEPAGKPQEPKKDTAEKKKPSFTGGLRRLFRGRENPV
ncbi:MAG: 50S ribosomal protein L17 [Candidatus Omnitrophica bacterium]|nr:50S ribosomal protein L17 [Candidatus Omnitrophota bacterium]